MANEIPDILKSFGLSAESVERVRLSRGVVGKTTYAVITLLAVLAVIAARISPEMLIWIGVLGVVAFVVYFFGVLTFASRNPGVALLEGAELLRWQQTELAAKGTGPIPPSTTPLLPPAPADGGSLPASTSSEADNQ